MQGKHLCIRCGEESIKEMKLTIMTGVIGFVDDLFSLAPEVLRLMNSRKHEIEVDPPL